MQVFQINAVLTPKVLDVKSGFSPISLNIDNGVQIDQSIYNETFGFDINRYEIEYYKLSLAVFQYFLERSSDQWCLIYEKGVKINTSFESINERLKTLPKGTEIFFPYDKLENLNAIEGAKMSASKLGRFWGSYIYFIDRSGAKKMLQHRRILAPMDETLLQKSFKDLLSGIFTKTGWFHYCEEHSKSFKARNTALKKAIFNYPAWNVDQKKQAVHLLATLVKHANKLNIQLMLHAGTLLGGVRHAAIMPWDDDIDVSMLYKDLERFNEAIEEEGVIKITKWVYKKTASTYYKYWLEGGEKVEGYEYSFPFIDIWLVYDKENKISMTDGYVFNKKDYLPPRKISFEGIELYMPNKPMVVLDAMYKDWKSQITIFSWCHRLKKQAFKPLSLTIKVDENGRLMK